MSLIQCGQRACASVLLWQAPSTFLACSRVASALPRYASTSGASMVVDLKTDAQYDHEMETITESGQLGVVDFTAVWCGPCRTIAPVYDAMSKDFPEVKFYRVDIDDDPIRKTVQTSGISAVPTFKFIKAGKTVAMVAGADKARILDLILKHK